MHRGLRLPTVIIIVGDPAFVNVPTRALISQAYLKPRAEEIRKADKALENIQAGKFGKAYAQGMAVELPSTSHLVVVDKRRQRRVDDDFD